MDILLTCLTDGRGIKIDNQYLKEEEEKREAGYFKCI
jgi:hypothetical protein